MRFGLSYVAILGFFAYSFSFIAIFDEGDSSDSMNSEQATFVASVAEESLERSNSCEPIAYESGEADWLAESVAVWPR